MPITNLESTSERKSIDVTVTPSAAGVSVAGSVRWFDALYTIPPTAIPCVYVDDETYRVVLASSPPRLVLVESGTPLADEVCYLARWRFASNTDTCASVAIECPRRVLVPRPPQVGTRDVMGTVSIPVMLDGEPVLDDEGNHVMRDVERVIGTETFEIPPEPMPDPVVVQVASAPVLPAADPDRTRGRKRRKRIKTLTEECRLLREAGTTFANMTAAEKAKVNELTALLADVPLAVP